MDYPLQPDAPGGRFVDSGANGGDQGTVVRAQQMNALHDEIINVIRASGQEPDANNVEQLREALSVLGGSARTNSVINGGFQVWQRGIAHDVTNQPVYTADRWEVQADGANGSGTGRVSQQKDASAPARLKGRWDYMRYEQQNNSTAGGAAIRTKLEVLPKLSGQRLTLSFLAMVQAPMEIAVELSRVINSVPVVVSSEQFSISQAWEQHSMSFTLENVGPLDPDADPPYLQIEFQLPDIDGNAFELSGVQLEIGDSPSGFAPRPFSEEHDLCRRYYQTSGQHPTELDTPGSTPSNLFRRASIYASAQSSTQFAAERLNPEMRAIPTVTYTHLLSPGFVSWGGVTRSVIGATLVHKDSIGIPTVAGGAPTSRADCLFRWTADAEI